MQYLKSYQNKKNKNSSSSSPIFLFFFENQYTEKQQRHAYGKENDI
jgi:hypothetical protein